jgi:hypothetical protein
MDPEINPASTNLTIEHVGNPGELARALSKCRSLEEVELRGSAVTDEVVTVLPLLHMVTWVILDGCNVTDSGIRALAASRSITTLWIRRCDKIGDPAIAALGAAEQIDHLFVEMGNVSGSGFSTWDRNHRLSRVQMHVNTFQDVGLEHLCRLRHLESVDLRSADVTDRIWDHLLAMPALRSISLFGCKRLTHPALERAEVIFFKSGRNIHLGHNIPKRVPADQSVSRKKEKRLRPRWSDRKAFLAEDPGKLNAAVRRQLQRLGAKPGKPLPAVAAFPAPLRELLAYRWPKDVSFANDLGADDAINPETHHVETLKLGYDPNCYLDDHLCLQGRKFLCFGYSGQGGYLLLIPVDSEMAEDPPVYLVDHEWYSNEDAQFMTPMSLSDFLGSLAVE